MKTIRVAAGIICEGAPDASRPNIDASCEAHSETQRNAPFDASASVEGCPDAQHGTLFDQGAPAEDGPKPQRNTLSGSIAADDGCRESQGDTALGSSASEGAVNPSNENPERILAVRRGYGDMKGLWEFPGGKVKRGETPAAACKRELAEELKVHVTDLRDIYTVEYDYPDFHLSMECFTCRIEAGVPQKSDRQLEIRWVERRSLANLEWMPADVELVKALSKAPGEQELSALAKRRHDSRHSMQGNKRQNTKPELLVRKRLREAGLTGYRLQWKKAPGRPDIAFPGRKIAIFVNGCFWHRCPHCSPSMPKRNVEFWEAKFRRNVERDKRAISELEALGWTPITIWECELKRDKIDKTMERVIERVQAARTRRSASPKPVEDRGA